MDVDSIPLSDFTGRISECHIVVAQISAVVRLYYEPLWFLMRIRPLLYLLMRLAKTLITVKRC